MKSANDVFIILDEYARSSLVGGLHWVFFHAVFVRKFPEKKIPLVTCEPALILKQSVQKLPTSCYTRGISDEVEGLVRFTVKGTTTFCGVT